MAFATNAELEDWLGYTLDASETTRATLVLEVASATIQAYTRQTISEVSGDAVELKGTWEHVLELPERPVTAVASVSVDGVAQTVTTDYLVVKNELRRPNAEYHNWQMPSNDFYPFAKTGWGGPSSIVAVTYTHGFDPVPDDIKGVTLQLATRMWSNPEVVAMKSIDGNTWQYGMGHSNLLDGEKMVLSKYRRNSQAVSVW